MFLNSIRWRLQLWHGLVLVMVLAGFGFTAHLLDRESRFRRIDQELQRRHATIAGVLRRGPGRNGPPNGRPPGPDGQPPRMRDDGRGQPPRNGPDDQGPPPEDATQGAQPPPRDFKIPERDLSLFSGDNTNSFYFLIWHRDGSVLVKSDSAPDGISRPAMARGTQLVPRMRETSREVYFYTPPGECVLVGCELSSELAEMRRFEWLLFGAGSAVLVLGLAGGWWLSSRAIRPIETISSTAVKIAAGDLSQRIDTTDTDNELGKLAVVLNSTFARLETSFAQQQQFTSDAAHELRTPITVLLTQTQMALNRERTAEEYRETVAACQRAAQRMRRLIESLLALARLDAGQENMKRLRFDLAKLAGDCVEQVRPLAETRGLKLQCDVASIECQGDPERITQVLTNLLTNAIHYNQDKGEVRVKGELQNGGVVLAVTDTGVGISAEDLPHIFERFYRADKSRSGASGHTGLGLAITKAIVEAHGGTIEAASELGVGTTFTIRLPVARND